MSYKREIDEIRSFGLTYPGAHIKSPWENHADLAVNDKTFVYLPKTSDEFTISCKLPTTASEALGLPFCKPTSYGLGKWGWVTATITEGEPPVELFKDWVDESYRSQAPQRLIKELNNRNQDTP